MATASVDKTDVFEFLAVRAPNGVATSTGARHFIRDDLITTSTRKASRRDVDLQKESRVGRIVFDEVFCQRASDVDQLIGRLLEELLIPYVVRCPVDDVAEEELADDANLDYSRVAMYVANPGAIVATTGDLTQAHLQVDSTFYILPDKLERLTGLEILSGLLAARTLLVRAESTSSFQKASLIRALEKVFGKQLDDVVFDDGRFAVSFAAARRGLFDALYVLYVLRRRAAVNLEDVMQGLQVLHALEWLAIDAFLTRLKASGRPKANTPEAKLLKTLEALLPELQPFGFDVAADLTIVKDRDDLRELLSATPVVHPIFGRLHVYKHPFNPVIRPLGIGDLKVVKQWLLEYLPSEISHITNMLKGEFDDRTFRRLQKTDEQFAFTSEQQEEAERESQSTDRLEIKREAENVLKTDLQVKADASFQYDNKPITVNVSGGFAYGRSSQDTSRTAEQVAREVIEKAVSRVQSRMAQQRSITKVFETEETIKHTFDNKGGTGHVAGVYRWVDKKYRAQVHSYGKRMMFEFVIPEPAAFFAESRLRAFQTEIECPQPPTLPTYATVTMPVASPANINEAKFNELSTKYDLSAFSYPVETRRVALPDQATGQAFFRESGIPNAADRWYSSTYRWRPDAKGYEVTRLIVTGGVTYASKVYAVPNLFRASLDGNRVFATSYTGMLFQKFDAAEIWLVQPHAITRDEVNVVLQFHNVSNYDLSFAAELRLSATARLDWQTKVYNAIRAEEQKKVDAENREKDLVYNAELAEYRRQVDELKELELNSVLQGQSEAFNARTVNLELKKHCLTLLSKEFDADESDDRFSNMATVKEKQVAYEYDKFVIEEQGGITVCGFRTVVAGADYPSIDLEPARVKGHYLQFLEQAFEWDRIAYVFYPYFWSTPPKWVELANRGNDADMRFSAFLQAGAAKVLIAVSPAYNDAVLHFLATGEPWEGGPAPVIGDPLFVPLHEELRRQQDDLANAVAEGEAWTFTVPTSLVYLQDSGTVLPKFALDGTAP